MILPGRDEERYYCCINYVYQPTLATLPFGSFFDLCRLRGVSFDLRARHGTAFMMMDSLASGTLGVLTCGVTPVHALRSLGDALQFLEEQSTQLRVGPVHVYDSESNLKECSNAVKALIKAKPAT